MLSDRTTNIRASVSDTQFELMLAIALVVMIIYVFLRNVPATIIPGIAVPLSLVGTFAVMVLLDFSINNLTLMALTIATGFVVDDAIVVIENISRYIEKGEKPLAAALKGAGEIGFTIISLTFSLIAVLIPLLFMGDIVGRLFREFAITLAVAILISAVVSLTLTPMMCARMLSHESLRKQNRFSRASERFFERVIAVYGRWLSRVLNHPWLTLSVALGTLVLSIMLWVFIPKGFFPIQDNGIIQGRCRRRSRRRSPIWPSASSRCRRRYLTIRRWKALPPTSASTVPTRRSTAPACKSTLSRWTSATIACRR